MLISDLPPQMPVDEVRMYCSVEASTNYGIPPELLYAVALTEGGTPEAKSLNSNGTYDLGYMQFNTAYLKTLEPYGVHASDVQTNSCYPFHLAAWRIRGHLDEDGIADPFTKAAYYHSRTPQYNEIYRRKLIANAKRFDFKKGTQYLKLMQQKLEDQKNSFLVQSNHYSSKIISDDAYKQSSEKTVFDLLDDDVSSALARLEEIDSFYIPEKH